MQNINLCAFHWLLHVVLKINFRFTNLFETVTERKRQKEKSSIPWLTPPNGPQSQICHSSCVQSTLWQHQPTSFTYNTQHNSITVQAGWLAPTRQPCTASTTQTLLLCNNFPALFLYTTRSSHSVSCTDCLRELPNMPSDFLCVRNPMFCNIANFEPVPARVIL